MQITYEQAQRSGLLQAFAGRNNGYMMRSEKRPDPYGNGGGRMPKAYTSADGTPSWEDEFPAYPQINLQVTREFRHFSLYIGGENLTNYRQPHPVVGAADPYSATFEPTLVWGPVHGIMAYAGLRMNL